MNIKILSLTLLSFITILGCTKSDKVETEDKKVEETIEDEEEKLEAPQLNFQNAVKPIVFEYTSTGCPGCGSWGKPTFNAILEQNKNDVEAIAIHIKYGDPMITTHSTEIGANRHGQFYTPQIWVNDSNGVVLNGGSINGMASVERLNSLIAFHKQNPSDILTDISFDKGTEKVAVRYGAKANEAKNKYTISCYLIENDVVAQQSSHANNPAKHSFVLREASNGTFGNDLALTSNNGFSSEFETEFELKNPQGKYKLTVVVWEKVGNRHKPIGAYSVSL
jgi:hypothetical protein